jgi:geranylgeranyl diphosphate synthase, type II
MNSFSQRFDEYLAAIEKALPGFLPEQPEAEGGRVVMAARYSLLGGGKRIRPILLLGTGSLLGVDQRLALPFACALEMIHTYSLIHDDLPCMDNDDLRRGRPTCHVAFGEAMAVLAGDALLNRAYEILLAAVAPDRPGSLAAARQIAAAAGVRGMIGGQALDLAAENQLIQSEDLRRLHQMKTGALIRAPILAAACLADASRDVVRELDLFAVELGLAFQIQDDILDVTADCAALGKTPGKDDRDRKSTYVSLYGLNQARQLLHDGLDAARRHLDALRPFGLDSGFLAGLTDYFLVRNH